MRTPFFSRGTMGLPELLVVEQNPSGQGDRWIMDVRDNWPAYHPDAQRVLVAVGESEGRVDAEEVFGALAGLDGELGAYLRDLNDNHGLDLPVYDELPEGENPKAPASPFTFSARVRETLNFFRIHHLRPVTPELFALKLLQMNAGRIDRDLEAAGVLKEVQQQLQELVEKRQ